MSGQRGVAPIHGAVRSGEPADACVRGLCAVLGSFGRGQGGIAALIRFTPEVSSATYGLNYSLTRAEIDA